MQKFELTQEELKKMYGLDSVIKLSFNENPFGPSPRAIDAINRTVYSCNLYPDPKGRELKGKLSDLNGIEEENIILGNGADEILDLIARALLRDGDEAITAKPTFETFIVSSKNAGAEVIKPLLKDHRFDVDGIINSISERTRAIYICNPNNPTGTILKRDELDYLFEKIDNNVCVIFDEAYIDFVDDKEYVSGLEYFKKGHNATVVRTFSKAYGLAGLRAGYAIAAPSIIEAMERYKLLFNENCLAYAAACAALEDIKYKEMVVEENRRNKKLMYKGLDELGFEYIPSETNFVLINTLIDSGGAFEILAKNGIIIKPITVSEYNTWIRVTVGKQDDVLRFLDAMSKLGEYIDEKTGFKDGIRYIH
ncbi:MAG: histidinol-phosphate transaminase [Thermoanaerobacteraceae bacterium]|nr:histidinol-phosphate transaminase [Thermoanaerobacteraceae bacterium]